MRTGWGYSCQRNCGSQITHLELQACRYNTRPSFLIVQWRQTFLGSEKVVKMCDWEAGRGRPLTVSLEATTYWRGLKVPPPSHTWVHLLICIVSFTPLETAWLPRHEEEIHKLYPVMRRQLATSSPVDRRALVPEHPEYPKSEEWFIIESVKGQVLVFDSTPRPLELNVKTTRYVHESWVFSFSDVFELASDTAMDSSLKCSPCLYKAKVCELPTLSPSRKTLFIAAGVTSI